MKKEYSYPPPYYSVQFLHSLHFILVQEHHPDTQPQNDTTITPAGSAMLVQTPAQPPVHIWQYTVHVHEERGFTPRS
jgi:hypothetical protein